jgi:HK97 family phage major capsid protein
MLVSTCSAHPYLPMLVIYCLGIFENPAMASPATSAKSVIFGHLPSYYVRTVGGLRLDRSDDFAFQNDLITFRATMRVDGNLIQTSHVKYFAGNAS